MKRLFAMDTSFYHSLGSYDFDARCEMLAELGYDGAYLTLWNDHSWRDLPALATVRARHGLEVAGVYVTFDLAHANDESIKLARLIDELEGTTAIELAVMHSGVQGTAADASVDKLLTEQLELLLTQAQRRGISLLLYPHINFYIERLERAVELCTAIDHPNLGVAFTGFHWYAADGKNLPQLLQASARYLRSANLCGSRKNPPGAGMSHSIECLDEGELDNFAVLGLLQSVGFTGWVGLQGYSVGGDVYTKLRRSLSTYRDMLRRLESHPNWAKMRT